MTTLWQSQKDNDELAEKNFELRKYTDPEWARIKSELKALDMKDDMDIIYQMQKQQYKMTKAYAEMAYH